MNFALYDMEIAGYIASILIGISLGLIGSGGSILTVPVLVYLFKVDPVSATAYSLFVVGSTATIGAVDYLRKGLLNLRTAFVFGIPSVITVFFTRAFIVPAIPTTICTINSFTLTKGTLFILLFATLMLTASFNMIKTRKTGKAEANSTTHPNYLMVLLQGVFVGLAAGMVGAGGGFLIIPALVLLCGLEMKKAIGTSLLIIAAQSLIGFLGESSETMINWTLLLKVTGFAISGIFIGVVLAKRIDGSKLKPAFGWFVLAMGVYIITREIFFS